VNVVNRISCFPYIFLRGDWGWLWPPWPPAGYVPEASATNLGTEVDLGHSGCYYAFEIEI